MRLSTSSWTELVGRMTRHPLMAGQNLSADVKRNLLAAFSRISQRPFPEHLEPIIEAADVMDRSGDGSVGIYVDFFSNVESYGPRERALVRMLTNRRVAVRATVEFAARDQDFLCAVRAGDAERDCGRWGRGEAAYRRALVLYPLHRGYTVQLAHMLKEQQRWLEAEINYRDALGLGAPESDVSRHLEFTVSQTNRTVDVETWSKIAEFWSNLRAGVRVDRWDYPPTYTDVVKIGELMGRREPISLAKALDFLDGACSLRTVAERLAVTGADEGSDMSCVLASAMLVRAIGESFDKDHRDRAVE